MIEDPRRGRTAITGESMNENSLKGKSGERQRIEDLITIQNARVMTDIDAKDQVLVLMHLLGLALRRVMTSKGLYLRKDGPALREAILRSSFADVQRIVRLHNPFETVSGQKEKPGH